MSQFDHVSLIFIFYPKHSGSIRWSGMYWEEVSQTDKSQTWCGVHVRDVGLQLALHLHTVITHFHLFITGLFSSDIPLLQPVFILHTMYFDFDNKLWTLINHPECWYRFTWLGVMSLPDFRRRTLLSTVSMLQKDCGSASTRTSTGLPGLLRCTFLSRTRYDTATLNLLKACQHVFINNCCTRFDMCFL